MQASKIPATVITGFLGSGKTTLIRNLLTNANGRRIALIINEFGDLGVDGEVLKSCGAEACSEEDIVELTNGCICCTVADDFIPTMEKLLSRDRQIDHIVIETSGLALPQPLVQAFNWPGIKTRVTVDGVITVVDSAAVAAGRFADDVDAVQAQRAADDNLDHDNPLEEVFEDQIIAADLVILNKTDLLASGAMAGVRDIVSGAATRKVTMVEAQNGELPIEVLLGIGAGTEDLIGARKSHHEMEHEAGGTHDHDDFDSFVASSGSVGNVSGFTSALQELIGAHDILRLKGFVDVPGKPMRLIVQAVGTRIDSYFDRPWGQGEARATRLVVIGQTGIDRAAIASAIEAAAKAAS
ncbi:MAG: cobalamin biosynthesis protein CobW [Rhizobiaceae bacterium]